MNSKLLSLEYPLSPRFRNVCVQTSHIKKPFREYISILLLSDNENRTESVEQYFNKLIQSDFDKAPGISTNWTTVERGCVCIYMRERERERDEHDCD